MANKEVRRTGIADGRTIGMAFSGVKRVFVPRCVELASVPNEKKSGIGVRNLAWLSLGMVEAKTPRPPLSAEPETRRAAAPLTSHHRRLPTPAAPTGRGLSFSRPGVARPIL